MVITDNFISNNCFGGFLYNELGLQYKNPFIWSIIYPNDYKKLMANYENIDFSNYKLDIDNSMYFIEIDNIVKVFYPHYKYDEATLIATKVKNDIFYKDIDKYIIEKYNERCDRMTKEPIFMLCRHTLNGKIIYKRDDFIDVISNNHNRKILLFSEYDFPKEIIDATLKTVKLDTNHFKTHRAAELAKKIIENEFNIK